MKIHVVAVAALAIALTGCGGDQGAVAHGTTAATLSCVKASRHFREAQFVHPQRGFDEATVTALTGLASSDMGRFNVYFERTSQAASSRVKRTASDDYRLGRAVIVWLSHDAKAMSVLNTCLFRSGA